MSSRAKRSREYIGKVNRKYFYGVLCSVCQLPFYIRIGYCFDILFKRWKLVNNKVVKHGKVYAVGN